MPKDFYNITARMSIFYDSDIPGRIYYRIPDNDCLMDGDGMDENVLSQWAEKHKEEILEKLISDIRSGKVEVKVSVGDSDSWPMEESEMDEVYDVDNNLESNIFYKIN